MVRASCILLICLIPVSGFCQAGFYLTYPCKRGNPELKKFDPSAKDLCLVSSPVVTLHGIISVTEHDFGHGKSMIELRLSPESHRKLRTAMDLSPLIAFIYDDAILFVFEPSTTTLHEVIRIYQVDYPLSFHRWKDLVRAKNTSPK